MTIQFSRTGPAFPEPFVDALLSGDVVFLCGAGISAPQLPGFDKLVEQCFERLHVEQTPSEKDSFARGRYEEVLGSLSRRLSAPEHMTNAVVQLLQTPADPRLDNHRTILKLSRDRENRPLIVTTNFDTLLEQALLEKSPPREIQKFSSAGQDLPLPGSGEFHGIIHLHGRLAAPAIGLLQTPLIVTSADYGDAYMRSGWASRFLFDLCRCKTVALLGYSAGDAPVRYFLNLLEADRQRFPELRRVYAFDVVRAGSRSDAEIRWGALAVEPLAYECETDGAGGHSALWRDLSELAELAERPQHTRRLWAQAILARPLAEADSRQTDRIAWLFRGTRDLWPVALETIDDPAWLDFFNDHELWEGVHAASIVASWMSRDFASPSRLSTAITWLERLGKPFAKALAIQLRQAKALPDLYVRAWRLITIAAVPDSRDWDEKSYSVAQALKAQIVLHADVVKAVDLLTPVLQVNRPLSELYGRAPPHRFERIHDLIWPRMHLRDLGGAPQLLDALVDLRQSGLIMGTATSRLRDVIQISIDSEALDGDYDSNDSAVPSIEPHSQNANHDGPVFLVQLLARLLPLEAELNFRNARALAGTWREMPGMLGIRLWLHALRHARLFTPDEAMAGLEALNPSAFWTSSRELSLVLRDRSQEADCGIVNRIEQRILKQGQNYYFQYALEDGQTEWRDHARDAGVWLRLNMLAAAGKLSEAGILELAAIKARRSHLDREVEDSDFFGSYSTGVKVVVGDASPILQASADDRLEVAQAVIRSPDIETHHGWSAYCRLDPRGAFDTLIKAPIDLPNAALWETLIGSLSFPTEDPDGTRLQLLDDIFEALKPASGSTLDAVARRLADLYWSTPRRNRPELAAWWPKLFGCSVEQDKLELQTAQDLFNHAINSAGGRLTLAALFDIQSAVQAGEQVSPHLLTAIEAAAGAPRRQGSFARATLVNSSYLLISIGADKVTSLLDAALSADTLEAAGLRRILVAGASLPPPVSRALHRHILRGVIEIGDNRHEAQAAAARIIDPALSIVRGEHDAGFWGIGTVDTIACLRRGPPALREGAALLLRNWIGSIGDNPAKGWREGIRPLLEEIWPRESALREARQASHFAELAIAAEEAFPEALQWLLPYICPGDSSASVHHLEQSKAPEDFPSETLVLLWRLFGGTENSEIFGLASIVDRLIKAAPQLEFDRRLQTLNQRAMRFS